MVVGPLNHVAQMEDMAMRSVDLSPLYRASVGFDRMMNLLDATPRVEDGGYPPYNIEKTGDSEYRITMAVAGFGEQDIDVTVQENRLIIKASKEADPAKEAKGSTYLHRGIATRAFERRFDLADHIKVTGARLENGVLSVELAREIPEAMKPRSIKIESRSKAKVIENAAA